MEFLWNKPRVFLEFWGKIGISLGVLGVFNLGGKKRISGNRTRSAPGKLRDGKKVGKSEKMVKNRREMMGEK